MRVLSYFGGRLLESRGTPLRARNLTQSLASLPGIEVLALSGDPPSEARDALEVDHLSIPAIENRQACLRRAVESFCPDVIYGHTHKAMIEMHGLGQQRARKVVDLHGDLAIERLESTSRTLSRRLLGYAKVRLSERRHLRAMDAFTVVSRPLAERPGVAGKPTRVVWGGVDVNLFRSLSEAPAGNLRVSYAGNFRPYQGVEVLLETARRLVGDGEPYEFSFVGDIDRFPDLKRAAVEQLGDRLEIHGQVPYGAMPKVLSGAHILVIPRPAHRAAKFGFPSKLAEYLAMERPTVASRVGDLEHAITDNETGLLVTSGSVAELHSALLRLKDSALRRRLGRAGRRYAEQHLAWPVLARQVECFLKEIVADRG